MGDFPSKCAGKKQGDRGVVHVSCTSVIYGQILNVKMRDRFNFNLSWEIEPPNDCFSVALGIILHDKRRNE